MIIVLILTLFHIHICSNPFFFILSRINPQPLSLIKNHSVQLFQKKSLSLPFFL